MALSGSDSQIWLIAQLLQHSKTPTLTHSMAVEIKTQLRNTQNLGYDHLLEHLRAEQFVFMDIGTHNDKTKHTNR